MHPVRFLSQLLARASLLLRRRTLSIGERGERLAAYYLVRQGWKIVARNWRDVVGELDIVAVDNRTVVFVEVKTWSIADQSPALAVDHDKQTRLTRLALRFLKQHDLLEVSARFDVIAIRWPVNQRPLVEHIIDAFVPTGKWQFFS